MRTSKNEIGKKYGRWTVIKKYGLINKRTYWTCICECGTIREVDGWRLRAGTSLSCGCKVSKQNNLSSSRIYKIWSGIKARCFYKKGNRYDRYGGRGITICDEWKDNFMSFYNWAINNGYKNNLSIDRIDNNKNYEHNNCRWATKEQQANNKSNNVYIVFNNKRKTIAQWARSLNVSDDKLRSKIKKEGAQKALIKLVVKEI